MKKIIAVIFALFLSLLMWSFPAHAADGYFLPGMGNATTSSPQASFINSGAKIDRDNSGQVVNFVDNEMTCAIFFDAMIPSNYGGGNMTVDANVKTDTNVGSVNFKFYTMATTPNAGENDNTASWSAANEITIDVEPTSNDLGGFSLELTNMDNAAAFDNFKLKGCRDTNDALDSAGATCKLKDMCTRY